MTSIFGYTYFIFQKDINDGIIQNQCKIGSTKHDLLTRAKELQTGNPNELVAYKAYHTIFYKEWEKYLHFILSHSHIQGEWYKLSTKQVDHIYNKYKYYVNNTPPLFTRKHISNKIQESIDQKDMMILKQHDNITTEFFHTDDDNREIFGFENHQALVDAYKKYRKEQDRIESQEDTVETKEDKEDKED